MGRTPSKEYKFVTDLTENWIKTAYPQAKQQDAWNYKNRMNMFLEFIGMTDAEFIEGYKRAKDRLEWAKQTGLKVVAYYNKRLSEGRATNSARTESSTVRAFCRDNATTLMIQRKRIAKEKSAMGEHEFTRDELSKMFYVADVRGKAVLAVGVSLGFSI
jgi:hypothetical protein